MYPSIFYTQSFIFMYTTALNIHKAHFDLDNLPLWIFKIRHYTQTHPPPYNPPQPPPPPPIMLAGVLGNKYLNNTNNNIMIAFAPARCGSWVTKH